MSWRTGSRTLSAFMANHFHLVFCELHPSYKKEWNLTLWFPWQGSEFRPMRPMSSVILLVLVGCAVSTEVEVGLWAPLVIWRNSLLFATLGFPPLIWRTGKRSRGCVAEVIMERKEMSVFALTFQGPLPLSPHIRMENRKGLSINMWTTPKEAPEYRKSDMQPRITNNPLITRQFLWKDRGMCPTPAPPPHPLLPLGPWSSWDTQFFFSW